MSIGQQIRKAREEQRLTQIQLAAKAGVSRPTIARVELGAAISVATLEKIVEALGLTVELQGQ